MARLNRSEVFDPSEVSYSIGRAAALLKANAGQSQRIVSRFLTALD